MSDIYVEDALPTPELAPAPPSEPADNNIESPVDLSAFETAAKRTRRAVIDPNSPNPINVKQLPQVFDEATYAAVPMGEMYLDPEGQKRTKPWRVLSARDYDKVPEGANYVDPEGTARVKPKFEPVSFTTQTLYDMALTDKERKKILESEYGADAVKQDAKGLYVIDNEGTYRKPGRGMTAVTGGATAMVAPVAGAVLGTIGGGAAGAAGGPAGVFIGGTVGSGTGGTLGQFLNDMVLQLAGVYDRTPGEQAGNLGVAGLTSMMGAGVGRGIATVVPTVKEGLSKAGAAAPAVARKILGTSEEDLRLAKQIADQGTAIPPSAVMKEAPHLQNIVERFHPAMDTSNPTLRSVEQHYERGAQQILKDLGVPEFQTAAPAVREPVAATPVQRVGEALRERAILESKSADDALAAAIEARKTQVATNTAEFTAQREALLKAQVDAKEAAERLVQSGLDEMGKTADMAIKTAKANHNSGDLWQAFADQLVAVKRGLMDRASLMYKQADELAGNARPAIGVLPTTAREFLEQLPEDFQRKYPDIVKKLEDLGGVFNKETGEMIKPPQEPTFGQLRQLRTLLRGNADWHTLSGDLRNGTYKFFSQQVDNALHNVKAVPELEAAVRQLDLADEFYRKNMPVFEAKQINAVMRGLEAGLPADPSELYRVVVKEGQTELTNKIRQMVGENLWAGVKAADMRTILDNSADLIPGVTDGGKFVREVLDRHRSGLLDAVHGKDGADKIRRLAEEVRALTNDRIPIQVRQGDNVMETIQRARQAAQEAKKVAAKDPLAALAKEMKQVEREAKRQPMVAVPDPANPGQIKMVARKDDPLGFLYDPTVGAAEATKKILASEDLLFATATRFGKDSAEFNMLRQAYAQNLLQGVMNPAERLAKISPDLQVLMFPGVTARQMETLAKEMNFLMNTKLFQSGDFGGALSATAKVEHPIAGRLVSGVMKMFPGVNMAARSALAAYYKMVTDFAANRPETFAYLLRGLDGTPEQRAAVRAILTKHAQRYAAMGAGVGEGLYQRPRDDKRR